MKLFKKLTIVLLSFTLAQNTFAFILSNNEVLTGTASGTEVGSFTPVGSTYTFVSGTGDEDNSKFTISGNKLNLNFTPDINNPTDLGDTAGNNTYSVRINQHFSHSAPSGSVAPLDYARAKNEYSDNEANENGDTYYGGDYNANTQYNNTAFAFVKPDGTIDAWGSLTKGGAGFPTDNGYEKIYASLSSFSAVKADGTVACWGQADSCTNVPTTALGSGTKVYSGESAFSALATNGDITCWGIPEVCTNAPANIGTGAKVYSSKYAFAGLKSDGSITAWGHASYGGTSAPVDDGYEKIYSTGNSFSAVKANGIVACWGDSTQCANAPTNVGTGARVYASVNNFVAVEANGDVTCWGNSTGCTSAPANIGTGAKVYAGYYSFVAVEANGDVTCWGDSTGCTNTPANIGTGAKVYTSTSNFVAVETNGDVTCWGDSSRCTGAPASIGTGDEVYTNPYAFAVVKSDGSIEAWGGNSATSFPTDSGYEKIYSIGNSFSAVKADGTVSCWGASAGCDDADIEGNKIITVTNGDSPVVTTQNKTINIGTNFDLLSLVVSATDTEDGDVKGSVTVSNDGGFDKDTMGTYTITFTVSDSHSNTTNATATVTVASIPVIVTNDASITIGTSLDLLTLVVSAVDAEDGDLKTSVTVSDDGGFDKDTVGVYTVTFTVSDSDSNTATSTATVTVTNGDAPVITTKNETITIGTTLDLLSLVVSATDTEDGDVKSSVTVSNDGGFDKDVLGTYTITFTVSDSHSNTTNATATVTVTNGDAPVITTKNETITVGTTLDLLDLVVSATDTEDGDVKGNVTVSNDGGFDKDVLGTYTITFTVSDSHSNTSTSTATVTVKKKSSSSSHSVNYVCKDEKATNYNKFGRHKQSLCEYAETQTNTVNEVVTNTESEETTNVNTCSLSLKISDNMKKGDKDGQYSGYNKGVVTEVKLLQIKLNIALKANLKVDGIFGKNTKAKVQNYQSLNNLSVDGVVGVNTKKVLNGC